MGGAARSLTVSPISGALGAEVAGVDLAQIDDAAFAAIHDAYLAHQVLVFRDQDLSAESYAAFARRFGTPAEYPFAKGWTDIPSSRH